MIKTVPSELQRRLDELRNLHLLILATIQAAEMLLLKQDDLEKLKSALAASHRFSLKAHAVVKAIEDEVPNELKTTTISFQMKK